MLGIRSLSEYCRNFLVVGNLFSSLLADSCGKPYFFARVIRASLGRARFLHVKFRSSKILGLRATKTMFY